MKKLIIYTSCLAWTLAGCGAAGEDAAGPGNVGFGGAQDIGQFRSILDQGEIPGEETLDANGFFSEHYTELPAPECGQILCLHGMLSVGTDWLFGNYQSTLQVAMNSPVDPAELERLPLNMVAVIDTSGSMAEEDRIGYVIEGLHLLIDQLEEGDRLALVTYSSDVSVLADLSVPLDRELMHAQVNNLNASGLTNIYDALVTGFDIAAQAYDAERQNRVVLLSDGVPTAGITDDDTIMAMASDYVAEGIGLTTIGVGRDFNVNLMRGLAEYGAGNFYFVEDVQAVEEVFVDELDFFVTPLATAVNIEVLPGSGYELGEVVGTRLWKVQGNTGTVYIPGVFLTSRQSNEPDPNGRRGGGSALFINMVPSAGQPVDPYEVASVRLTYRLPGSTEVIEQIVDVTSPTAPGVPGEELYVSEEAMLENYAMYNMYLGLREATRSAVWDYNCALSQLQTLDEAAAWWNIELADEDIDADRAIIAQFMNNLVQKGAQDPDQFSGDVCSGQYWDDYPYEDDYVYYGCSVSGDNERQGAGMLVLLLATLTLMRRRRRSS